MNRIIAYVPTPISPPAKDGSEMLLRRFTNKSIILSIKLCYAVELPTLNYWSHVFMITDLCVPVY